MSKVTSNQKEEQKRERFLSREVSEICSLFYSMKTIKDLSSLLEIEHSILTFIVYRDHEPKYKEFTIYKKNGGLRKICSPRENLKKLQLRLKEVFEIIYNRRNPVHGYTKNKSIITNAQTHVGKRYVCNIDLEDFFPSINFGRVRGLFISYPYNVNQKIATLIAQICCDNNQLPQGAPSSPIISNMICSKLDSELQRLAKKHSVMYTRYADDITISSNASIFPKELALIQKTTKNRKTTVSHELEKVIQNNGFKINQKKTRLQEKNWHQEVTGLTVNEFTNVKRKFVRQVRAMLHAWKKYGLSKAANEYKDKYKKANQKEHKDKEEELFISVVIGKLEFLRSVRGSGDHIYIKYAIKLRELHKKYRPSEDFTVPNPSSSTEKHDVFICHASEDKKEIIVPIINAFKAKNISYWYDNAEIKWGDQLAQKINEGLSRSRYVMVALSPKFMEKNWTQAELNAALNLEASSGETKVLILLIGNDEEKRKILEGLPLLASKRYLTWDNQSAKIANELKVVLKNNDTSE